MTKVWKREESAKRQNNNRDRGGGRSRGGGREWYSTYGKPTLDRDTGLEQTNYYAGWVGEKDQLKKVHVGINVLGEVVFVRDVDGTVLYDRKNGIGYLPPDLNWSR